MMLQQNIYNATVQCYNNMYDVTVKNVFNNVA